MNHSKITDSTNQTGTNEVDNSFGIHQRIASLDLDNKEEKSSRVQTPRKGRREESPQNENGQTVRRKSPNQRLTLRKGGSKTKVIPKYVLTNSKTIEEMR